jgi:RNA-directed DNA polymerase
LMKERKQAIIPQSPQMPKKPVPRDQNRLPWKTWEQQVVRLQKQIAQAYQHGDRQAVSRLQQRLMESEAARLLAVRRVTEESQGKDTAGVDGVRSLSPTERLAMAATIHPANWKQQQPEPVRRVWIPKPGTSERRPLAILPMIDRCKQALVKLALEPEWEMRFEAHSYGYRPGRGVHDAIAAILVATEHHPTFVYCADIEGAFDHINQNVLLDKLQTFPAIEQVLRGWFKAGSMDGGVYVPSEMGIAQGGVLSPLLLNIALHGMEEVVTGGKGSSQGREHPLLIRYGDDFVILHADLHELHQAETRVRRWLATLGLQLNAQKTRISHTLIPFQGEAGFDFLSFHLHQEQAEKQLGGKKKQEAASWVKTIVTPSLEARQRHLAALEQKLRQGQSASQAQVIKELNPLIIGWTSYYNGIVEAVSMGQYDEVMEQRLLQWASKRHPGQTRDWLLARYWQQSGHQARTFATADGVKLRPYRQTSILKNSGSVC